MNALASAAAALLFAQVRGQTRRSQLTWAIIGTISSFSALLSIQAIYPKTVKEPCPRCEKKREVGKDRCEHCDGEWESPASDGIEMIGMRNTGNVSVSQAVS